MKPSLREHIVTFGRLVLLWQLRASKWEATIGPGLNLTMPIMVIASSISEKYAKAQNNLCILTHKMEIL